MATKEIVKGHCGDSKCTYDVYTKEKMDELLNKLEESLVGKKLKGDIDLNNITEEGIYVISDEMTSIINVPKPTASNPISGGEKLEVYKNSAGQISQKFIYKNNYIEDSEATYRRTYTDGTWGKWYADHSNEIIITGSLTVAGVKNTGESELGTKEINYPTGFTKGNSYVVALGVKSSTRDLNWVYGSESTSVAYDSLLGSGRHNVLLGDDKITVRLENRSTSEVTFNFRLILKELPYKNISSN